MHIADEMFKLDKGVGYMYAYVPEHPIANKSGKVYQHRYVAWLANNCYLPDNCHVHHRDGVRINNHPDNLEVLSAEDHVRLHCGEIEYVDRVCGYCKIDFKLTINRCRKSVSGEVYCSVECNVKAKRLFEVDRETLSDLVWSMPTTKVAEMFKVSDKAIEKRCKLLGVEKPPRGYWAKFYASRSPQESSKLFA